jgi:hypothetical protein
MGGGGKKKRWGRGGSLDGQVRGRRSGKRKGEDRMGIREGAG